MLHLVIDFQAVLSQAMCKGVQGPDGQALGINLMSHLSGNLASLRIASKLMEKLGPGLGQGFASDGGHQVDIQLRMIQMCSLKGTLTMTRGGLIQVSKGWF